MGRRLGKVLHHLALKQNYGILPKAADLRMQGEAFAAGAKFIYAKYCKKIELFFIGGNLENAGGLKVSGKN